MVWSDDVKHSRKAARRGRFEHHPSLWILVKAASRRQSGQRDNRDRIPHHFCTDTASEIPCRATDCVSHGDAPFSGAEDAEQSETLDMSTLQ